MKTFLKDNTILWRYCEYATSQMRSAVNSGKDINFKCNVCGDGKGNKKRGHLRWDNELDLIYYKCFNYGDCKAAEKSISGERWLKDHFPIFYQQYRKELIAIHGGGIQKPQPKKIHKIVLTSEEKTLLAEEKEHLKHFVPIRKSDDQIFTIARKICKDRKIPEDIWHKFFVATDGLYRNRLIIPFYDDKKKIYYYQARDLVGRDPKYLNRKLDKDKAIYNYPNIDKTKPVIVFEGPIDSMFVENSVAVMGVSFSKHVENKLSKVDAYYLLDNDEAGYKKSSELLKAGNSVFLWKKFLKDNYIPDKYKDINDVFIYLEKTDKFKFEELSKYFTTNYLDSIYLR